MNRSQQVIESIQSLNEATSGSTIGIEDKKGQVTYIYCHFGGHPDYQALHNNPFSLGFGRKELKQVGKILLNHYKDVKEVKELIALGDYVSISF